MRGWSVTSGTERILARARAGEPDRQRILPGPRWDRSAFELIGFPLMRSFFFVEKFLQNDDAFFQPADSLGVLDAHDLVFQCLSRTLLIRPAQADRQPRAAAGDYIETRPLLRQ